MLNTSSRLCVFAVKKPGNLLPNHRHVFLTVIEQHPTLYRQQDDGRFVDVTAWSGLENEGSQQISIADVDVDGDMDVMVGQSFNRLGKEQIAGRRPTMKVYLNQCVEKRRERERNGLPLDGVAANSIVLKLRGAVGELSLSSQADLDAAKPLILMAYEGRATGL